MRALIGTPECEIAPGASLSDLAHVYERKFDGDPMVAAMRMDTGSSQLVYILNGVVIKQEELTRTVLKDGDDVRIHHFFFGG